MGWDHKQELRKKIAAQVKKYLAAGGKIQKIGVGATSETKAGGVWERQINSERNR